MAEANYVEAVAQQDVISKLLDKAFAARTVCEQKDILQHKKPLPWLRIRTGSRIFQEEFDESINKLIKPSHLSTAVGL